jgi:hypothetical protein
MFLKGRDNTHWFLILNFSTFIMGVLERSFSWLILFTLCMHGIETDTLLAYVGFVLRLYMQYVENDQARRGRSMKLGGVGEAGAVGHNGTSPTPGSVAAIGTATAPGPNGTSTTAATPEGDGTSSSAAGNDSSESAEPHGTTFSPTTQAATFVVAC